jgi:hypothetical protein
VSICVLRVTQQMGQMGQAKLPFVCMPGLCRIAIGDPDLELGLTKEIAEHRGAAAIGDQMVDGDSTTHCHRFLPWTRAEVCELPLRSSPPWRPAGLGRGQSVWRSPLR